MIIKTAGGDELNATTITINERPKTVSFRFTEISLHDIAGIIYNNTLIPVEGYEEYTELDTLRTGARNDVTVVLAVPGEGTNRLYSAPKIITDKPADEEENKE